MTIQSLSIAITDLAPALKNHLWQSTIFALVAALLTLALRKNHAHTRCWLWLAASLKFLAPFSLLITLGTHLALPHPASPAPTAVYYAMEEVSQPFTPIVTPQSVTPTSPTPTHLLPILLATIWLFGVLTVLTTWFIYWRRITAIIRAATSIHEGRELELLRRLETTGTKSVVILAQPESQYSLLNRPLHFKRAEPQIQLLDSPSTLGPGIYGIFRPKLIWPAAISQRLDDAHLESVLAHEIAHVRRCDNLTATLHMLVEAIFWFHPIVWWLGTRLEAERERACDEQVLETSTTLANHPHIYAESILKICEFYVESPLPCVSGVTGADLKKRLTDILDKHAIPTLSLGKKLLLATIGILVIAIPILSGQARGMQRQLSAIVLSPSPITAILPSLQTPAEPAAATQPTPPDPAPATAEPKIGPPFEVATIRLADRNDGRRSFGIQLTPSGRFTTSATPLSMLVSYAYGAPGQGLVSGGPDWVEKDFFDINAKIEDSALDGWDKLPGPERAERVKPMLRALLADRFHLKLRSEIRQTPVYALTQAKGGTKMKAVDPPPAGSNIPLKDMLKKMQDEPGKAQPGNMLFTGDMWYANAVKVSSMLGQIRGTGKLDALVVDETGLTGYYDFAIHLSSDEDAPSLRDQIEQQLGLKLVPKKMPLKTYIIDSADKPSLDGAELSNPAPATLKPVSFTQQTAAPLIQPAPPTFEAVSIHPSSPDAKSIGWGSPNPGRFIGYGMTVESMIGFAYDIPYSQVLSVKPNPFNPRSPNLLGGPAWVSSDRFEIIANADEATIQMLEKLPAKEQKEQLRKMLQAMLADRFHLTMRHETQELPVWALVIAKSGPKLTTAPPHPATDASGNYQSPWKLDLGLIGADGVNMDALASMLWGKREIESRKVLNRTGLSGTYSFTLKWTPEEDDTNNTGTSLFTAIQEQLGLKLESTKAPLDVLVIDHIEKPSPN